MLFPFGEIPRVPRRCFELRRWWYHFSERTCAPLRSTRNDTTWRARSHSCVYVTYFSMIAWYVGRTCKGVWWWFSSRRIHRIPSRIISALLQGHPHTVFPKWSKTECKASTRHGHRQWHCGGVGFGDDILPLSSTFSTCFLLIKPCSSMKSVADMSAHWVRRRSNFHEEVKRRHGSAFVIIFGTARNL